MKTLIALALAVVVNVTLVHACLPGFHRLGDGCYKPLNTRLSWPEAKVACESMGYGVSLASIETADEQNRVTTYLHSLRPKFPGSHGFWLSGTDLAEEGQWFWTSTGQKIDYKAWHTNQPDNAGNLEHCVHLWWAASLKWNDIPCYVTDMYTLCEDHHHADVTQ